jgi:hypothetical protein
MRHSYKGESQDKMSELLKGKTLCHVVCFFDNCKLSGSNSVIRYSVLILR